MTDQIQNLTYFFFYPDKNRLKLSFHRGRERGRDRMAEYLI